MECLMVLKVFTVIVVISTGRSYLRWNSAARVFAAATRLLTTPTRIFSTAACPTKRSQDNCPYKVSCSVRLPTTSHIFCQRRLVALKNIWSGDFWSSYTVKENHFGLAVLCKDLMFLVQLNVMYLCLIVVSWPFFIVLWGLFVCKYIRLLIQTYLILLCILFLIFKCIFLFSLYIQTQIPGRFLQATGSRQVPGSWL